MTISVAERGMASDEGQMPLRPDEVKEGMLVAGLTETFDADGELLDEAFFFGTVTTDPYLGISNPYVTIKFTVREPYKVVKLGERVPVPRFSIRTQPGGNDRVMWHEPERFVTTRLYACED